MQKAEDVLALMGLDPEDVKAKMSNSKGDKRICVCGHPMSQHDDENKDKFCRMSRVNCHCSSSNRKPALEAEDASLFRYASDGPGPEHALSKGILASAQRGKKVEVIWDGYKCANPECHATEGLTPVTVKIDKANGTSTLLQKIRSMKLDPDFLRTDWRDTFMCPACSEQMASR